MVLIAAALAMATPPERWVRVDGIANLHEQFLDMESVRRTGDKVTLWTRRDSVPDRATTWNELEIDCALRTETVLAYIRDDGRTISHNDIRPHRDAAPIPPGSASARILDIACH